MAFWQYLKKHGNWA